MSKCYSTRKVVVVGWLVWGNGRTPPPSYHASRGRNVKYYAQNKSLTYFMAVVHTGWLAGSGGGAPEESRRWLMNLISAFCGAKPRSRTGDSSGGAMVDRPTFVIAAQEAGNWFQNL